MATMDQMNDDEKQFAAAFDEETPAAQGPTEDEEFGTAEPKAELPAEPEESASMDVESEDAGEASDGEPAAVALVMDSGDMEETADQAGAKDSAEASAEDGNQGETIAVADEGDDGKMDVAKELQRLRSWEGRLKAMEAKLKAAGADTPEEQKEVVAEAIEKSADATDTPADEDKVEQIADQVEDGTISPEQAMKQLAEDFGDEFVKMIEAIATAKAREAGGAAADERVSQISKTVDEVINDIVDTKAKAHFEMIAEKHPDFNEVGESEQFKAYIESMPEDQKGQALDVIASGTAKQIVALLDGFKKASYDDSRDAQPELTEAKESILDEVIDDSAMDAAEGVRSSGMKLPEQPQKADDYAAAWDEF